MMLIKKITINESNFKMMLNSIYKRYLPQEVIEFEKQ